MGYFGEQLEKTILSSLDACEGNLLSASLAFFDQVQGYIQKNHCEFQTLLKILRQNAGLDACQLWNVTGVSQTVLERADLSQLNIHGAEEQFALLQLLFTSATHELMAVSRGKSTLEESRSRLACKIEIIRRGAAMK